LKTLIFFISITALSLLRPDVSLIRKEYKEAAISKAKTKVLYKKLKGITKKDDKVLVAYKGAVIALIARQQKGAENKKDFFKKGIELLEYALKCQPNNIEIRFVRLTIQQNSPTFLNYNAQKEEDKAFILRHLESVKSSELKKYIIDYILKSKHFTKEEKSVFL